MDLSLSQGASSLLRLEPPQPRPRFRQLPEPTCPSRSDWRDNDASVLSVGLLTIAETASRKPTLSDPAGQKLDSFTKARYRFQNSVVLKDKRDPLEDILHEACGDHHSAAVRE